MANTFSIQEAIKFGWGKVRGHSGLVFGVTITIVALQLASSMLKGPGSQESVSAGVGSFLLALVGIVLSAGMLLIFLRLSRAEPARYRDIIPAWSIIWRYFCVSLVVGIVTFLPMMAAALIDLVLLSATGAINFETGHLVAGHSLEVAVAVAVGLVGFGCAMYLGLRYSMAKISAVDGMGINDSMHQSTKLTMGVKWRLVLFTLALLGINLLGFICLVVGLLVSIPVSMFAYLYVYLELTEAQG